MIHQFKQHKSKVSIKKYRNQRNEYIRQTNNKSSYQNLKSNVLTLKTDFLDNYKNNYDSWELFYNRNKNNQLNSVKQYGYKNNKHKSVSMWKSLLTSIRKLKNISHDNNTLSEDNYTNYITSSLIDMRDILVKKRNGEKNLDKHILGEYRTTNYNYIMSMINNIIQYCNKQIR